MQRPLSPFTFLLMLVGTASGASAFVMIRISDMHPVLLAASRLLLAAVLLTPLFIVQVRKEGIRWKNFGLSALSGCLLGLHFIAWNIGARLTYGANANLIVNIQPVFLPFIVFALYREKITVPEIIGTVIALSGIVLLTGSSLRLGGTHLMGDIMCLVAMVFAAFYLALAKRNTKSIFVYVVPLYYVGGVFCFIVSLFFVNPVQQFSTKEILCVVALAAIPTITGHTIVNYCMKVLRSQIVSVLNLIQILFASVYAYVFFGEIPSAFFYPASVLILAGAIIAILYKNRSLGMQTKKVD